MDILLPENPMGPIKFVQVAQPVLLSQICNNTTPVVTPAHQYQPHHSGGILGSQRYELNDIHLQKSIAMN